MANMNLMRKKDEHQLDPAVASQMLSNIFEACELEPNTVPLEVLTSYSNYRQERYYLQKTLLAIMLAAFLLLPVLFIAPKFPLTQQESDIPGNPVIKVSTENLMPVTQITASINDHELLVSDAGDGVYDIKPDRNGTLSVTVHLLNKQYAVQTFEVTNVDTDSPKLASGSLSENEITIFFTDDNGQLDFENIYAETPDGQQVRPDSYDETDLSVTFKAPADSLNIFVPDRSGNTLQLALTLN